jgi:hypothetical protein
MHDMTLASEPETDEFQPDPTADPLANVPTMGPVWYDPPEYVRAGWGRERRLPGLLIRRHRVSGTADVIVCHPLGQRLYPKLGVPVERITPRETAADKPAEKWTKPPLDPFSVAQVTPREISNRGLLVFSDATESGGPGQ